MNVRVNPIFHLFILVMLQQSISEGNPDEHPSPATLIVGGRDVRPGAERPWQAAIVIPGNSLVCGGTLIDLWTVLTAAHCVVHFKSDILRVVLGENNRNRDEGSEQYLTVRKTSVHPLYHNNFLSGYDIALLHLNNSATQSPRVMPVPALARQSQLFMKPSINCFITGWGVASLTAQSRESEEEDGKERVTAQPQTINYGVLSTKLQEADIDVISFSRCNSQTYWNGIVKNTNICAFSKDTSACEGDSGGPLVCTNKGTHILVGVTSWGSISCQNYPTVFTKVASFRQWIKGVVEQSKIDSDQLKVTNLTSGIQ